MKGYCPYNWEEEMRDRCRDARIQIGRYYENRLTRAWHAFCKVWNLRKYPQANMSPRWAVYERIDKGLHDRWHKAVYEAEVIIQADYGIWVREGIVPTFGGRKHHIYRDDTTNDPLEVRDDEGSEVACEV